MYLVRKNLGQIIHRSYSERSLVLGRKTCHEVRHFNALLPRWWLTHDRGRIWRETVHVHLGEVNCCVMAGTGKNNGNQKVVQLDTAREGLWDTMMCMACQIGIAVVM